MAYVGDFRCNISASNSVYNQQTQQIRLMFQRRTGVPALSPPPGDAPPWVRLCIVNVLVGDSGLTQTDCTAISTSECVCRTVVANKCRSSLCILARVYCVGFVQWIQRRIQGANRRPNPPQTLQRIHTQVLYVWNIPTSGILWRWESTVGIFRPLVHLC